MPNPTYTLLGITARGESGEMDAKGRYSYIREYEALFSGGNASNIKTLLNALKATVPKGSAYPGDTSARARRYSAAYKNGDTNERLMVGKVYFDNPDPNQLSGENELEPWNRPALWSCGTREVPIVTGHDVLEKAIKNYAGQLFDPVPEIPRAVAIYECRKAFDQLSKVTAWRAAMLTTNAAIVSIDGVSVAIGAGLVREVNYQEAYYGETKYYDASIRFEVSAFPWGWKQRLVQCGWYILQTENGVKVQRRALEERCEVVNGVYGPVKDKNNKSIWEPTALPVYLNEDGSKRDCVTGTTPNEPLYKDVQVYASSTWPTMPT